MAGPFRTTNSATTTTTTTLTNTSSLNIFRRLDWSPSPTLGILAFEAAKTMSRLISLYRSLTDQEFANLRKDVIRSQGVAYLNSPDESFLLSLACWERLEDLEIAAIAVSRLGHRCADPELKNFDRTYDNLKVGVIDVGKLEFGTKRMDKVVEKMEQLVSATEKLYSALECLTEMEISEKKLQLWRINITDKKSEKVNLSLFQEKIAHQRKQVRRQKDTSLWNRTFDKCVRLMARTVFAVYARVCILFGPYISDLPRISRTTPQGHKKNSNQRHIRIHPENMFSPFDNMSGPIACYSNNKNDSSSFFHSTCFTKFHSRELDLEKINKAGNIKRNAVFGSASPTTVGGSGLALRYANIIRMAEMYLNVCMEIDEEARGEMYEKLPERLRRAVGVKLRGHWKEEGGHEMAEGWRAAAEGIMEWLAPVAHDTVQWQTERNLERQRFDFSRPPVLLLQTLHFADLEKTEAAIVEVLVGLSCIYRYENRCFYG